MSTQNSEVAPVCPKPLRETTRRAIEEILRAERRQFGQLVKAALEIGDATLAERLRKVEGSLLEALQEAPG